MKTNNIIHRRHFITAAGAALATTVVAANPISTISQHFQSADITVGQVMDLFIKEIPGAPFAKTVDTLKTGNRDIVVTGIVTTMFATIDVIKKAIALKANFVIAHEPTFYNHQDQTDWLSDDAVYKYKAALLKEHNIAVWRNHDYVHSLATDGVSKEVVERLGWSKLESLDQSLYTMRPVMKLQQLIAHTKNKLGIQKVRFIGHPEQQCTKVLLIPGASGGMSQIRSIHKYKPDVLVCGEVSEWETAEYVRDAQAKGDKLALIVLGHVASEEPGSEFMAKWLKQHVPQVNTTHVPAGTSLSFA